MLGNHEFYGSTYAKGIQKARQLEGEPSLEGRFTLLQRGRHDFDVGLDVGRPATTILGCVLWSHIARESTERIAKSVNDFRQIQDWTPDAHNAAHAADLSWLQTELARIREEDEGSSSDPRHVVVVTHHAPLLNDTGSPRHKDGPLQSAFATDICAGPSWSSVKYWIFGHTHWTTDITARNGVRLVSNQRGYVYPGRTRQAGQRLLELPPKHTFDASACIRL